MPSPVTHITGYLYALEIAFAAGVKVVFMERWNAAEAVDLIARHGVTFSVGATPFLKELLAEVERSAASALASLRLFMSGGAPVPPELIYRANQQCLQLPDVPCLRQHRGADRYARHSAAAAEADLGANYRRAHRQPRGAHVRSVTAADATPSTQKARSVRAAPR